jgi:hypothetical protein
VFILDVGIVCVSVGCWDGVCLYMDVGMISMCLSWMFGLCVFIAGYWDVKYVYGRFTSWICPCG